MSVTALSCRLCPRASQEHAWHPHLGQASVSTTSLIIVWRACLLARMPASTPRRRQLQPPSDDDGRARGAASGWGIMSSGHG